MSATVIFLNNGFHIEGYEKVPYDFRFIDNNIHTFYGQSIESEFSEENSFLIYLINMVTI